MNLPGEFQFRTKDGLGPYNIRKVAGQYSAEFEHHIVNYSKGAVESLVEMGIWIIIENTPDKHMETCKRLNTIYKRKNADYGNSFDESCKEFGLVAGVVRMDDKMRRIKNLLKNPAQVKGESLKDTVDDLANYTIMLRNIIDELEVNQAIEKV